jgi:hypothetical protein
MRPQIASAPSNVVFGSIDEELIPGLPGVIPGCQKMTAVPSRVAAAESIGGQREIEELVARFQQLLVLERCDETVRDRCHFLDWLARRAGQLNAFNTGCRGMCGGRSKNVERRRVEMQRSQPFHINTVATFPGKGHLEGIIHTTLHASLVDGPGREWFRVSASDAIHTIAIAMRGSNV